MSSKVSCYLRTLRLNWALTQEDVASLLVKADRNRVRDVEKGKALPNAEEILAYAVIFGSCGKSVFPKYYGKIEEAVMARAYILSEQYRMSDTPKARRKLELITEMFARATGDGRAGES